MLVCLDDLCVLSSATARLSWLSVPRYSLILSPHPSTPPTAVVPGLLRPCPSYCCRTCSTALISLALLAYPSCCWYIAPSAYIPLLLSYPPYCCHTPGTAGTSLLLQSYPDAVIHEPLETSIVMDYPFVLGMYDKSQKTLLSAFLYSNNSPSSP